MFDAAAMAAAHFSFKFTGTMSCMSPVPVSNARPIRRRAPASSIDDSSVSADVTQSLLVFSTSLHFDSKISSGVTAVPGGTAQVRVAGRQSLRFIWNLPNNTLLVTIGIRRQLLHRKFPGPICCPAKPSTRFLTAEPTIIAPVPS